MIDLFVFLIAVIIAIRTFGYGIWTFSGKNILGGIFIFFIAALTAFLAAYLLIFDRT